MFLCRRKRQGIGLGWRLVARRLGRCHSMSTMSTSKLAIPPTLQEDCLCRVEALSTCGAGRPAARGHQSNRNEVAVVVGPPLTGMDLHPLAPTVHGGLGPCSTVERAAVPHPYQQAAAPTPFARSLTTFTASTAPCTTYTAPLLPHVYRTCTAGPAAAVQAHGPR